MAKQTFERHFGVSVGDQFVGEELHRFPSVIACRGAVLVTGEWCDENLEVEGKKTDTWLIQIGVLTLSPSMLNSDGNWARNFLRPDWLPPAICRISLVKPLAPN